MVFQSVWHTEEQGDWTTESKGESGTAECGVGEANLWSTAFDTCVRAMTPGVLNVWVQSYLLRVILKIVRILFSLLPVLFYL